MKPIKFDLPLNGTKIATLEQLEENLTPEILEPFRSGKLAKWLRARNLTEQAEAVDALLASHVENEVQLFKSLCEVFVSEVDNNDAREAIEEYNASISLKNAASEDICEAQQIELFGGEEQHANAKPSLSNNNAEDIKEAQQLKILEEGNENQRAELASYPDLSEKLQNKLLQDKEEPVLVALASNPYLLEEAQAKLASTGSPLVREALASNPKLNEKQQNYLATTGSEQVRCRLAGNSSLIVAVQSLLAGDEESSVRTGLARNPTLNSACQAQLLKDQNYSVRITLACNPALTDDFQQQMATSENDSDITSLAKNPSLSNELMAKLAASDIAEVKESLANNPSLPEPLQARLIANSRGNVREILAGNPALKVAQQAELTNSACNVGDAHLRLALLDNPSIDESLKTRIIASFDKYDLNSMESSLKRAEEDVDDLNSEHSKVLKKRDSPITGIFSAFQSITREITTGEFSLDTKEDQLWEESYRIQERQWKAERERDILDKKVCRLKDILNSQSS